MLIQRRLPISKFMEFIDINNYIDLPQVYDEMCYENNVGSMVSVRLINNGIVTFNQEDTV